MKYFFNECKNEVNERGKICEHHDKEDREVAADIAAIFACVAKKITA